METVFERHRAEIRLISGVYSDAFVGDADFASVIADVEALRAEMGRRPRLFVAKIGQDGHDRGSKVVATAFADLGFDVSVGPLFQTPEEAAADAAAAGADVVGVSSHAAGHLTLVPELVDALRAEGAGGTLVVCGGVIPPKDHPALADAGVSAVFGPGSNIPEAVGEVLTLLRKQASRSGADRDRS